VSQVLDSAAPISARLAKAAGYGGKLRYVSGEPAKNYTPAEEADDEAQGFARALVCEDGASDALGGANAGVAKAREVSPLLAPLKFSQTSRPVYLSCDFAPALDQFPACWEAIQAFAVALGRPTATYADWPLLDFCEKRGLEYGWAIGSSYFNTGPAPRRCLQQLAQQITLPDGTICDLNDVLASDWGQLPTPAQLEEEPMIIVANPNYDSQNDPNGPANVVVQGLRAVPVPDWASQAWLESPAGGGATLGKGVAPLPAGTVTPDEPPASLVAFLLS
jgi:hypothetical protein